MTPTATHKTGTWTGGPVAVPATATTVTFTAIMSGGERSDPDHRLWLQIEGLVGVRWVPLTGVSEWRGGPGAARPTVSVQFGDRPAMVRLSVGLIHETTFGFPAPTFTGV